MTEKLRGKLGKQAAAARAKDITFAAVRTAALPRAQVGFGHQHLIDAHSWGMLGNDKYGDCVFAGADHETMLLNLMNGRAVSFTSADALADYAAVTGFNPSTGAGDNGTDVHEALAYRRHTGVIDAAGTRHKIGAYVSLTAGDWYEMLAALRAFDFVAIGFNFPASADKQFASGQSWHYIGDTNIVGGHYVPIVGRPHVSTIDVLTWGQVQPMTRSFYRHYADEAYAILTPESLSGSGVTPEGLNLDALQSALARL